VAKLRKILVVVFGTLSVVFALIALSNALCQKDECAAPAETAQNPRWGKALEAEARKGGKLVFFSVSEELPESTFSENARDVLESAYVCAVLNPDAFPADYAVLHRILEIASSRRAPLKVGILSPRFKPVYLSSEIRAGAPSISDIVVGIASEHARYAETLQKTAQKTSEIVDSPRVNSPSENPRTASAPQTAVLAAQAWDSRMFFSDPRIRAARAALLAENARLAAKIYAADPSGFCARETLKLAAEAVVGRLKSDGETLASVLLLTRALSDIAEVSQDATLKKSEFNMFKAILGLQGKDGFLASENSAQSASKKLSENALALSILARAYSLTKDPKFLRGARRLSDALKNISEWRGELPAVISSRADSAASSREYALLAEAFLAMHAATKDPSMLKAARAVIDKWTLRCGLEGGLWSINSESSPLAEFARPIISEDSDLPSYLGVAAQMAAYMDKADPSYEFPFSQRLRSLSEMSLGVFPLQNYSAASLKMASL